MNRANHGDQAAVDVKDKGSAKRKHHARKVKVSASHKAVATVNAKVVTATNPVVMIVARASSVPNNHARSIRSTLNGPATNNPHVVRTASATIAVRSTASATNAHAKKDNVMVSASLAKATASHSAKANAPTHATTVAHAAMTSHANHARTIASRAHSRSASPTPGNRTTPP